MNILHITTVHPRRDTRIFYRECVSIRNAGYKTYLLVADGLGDENINQIQVLDLGKEKSRIKNFIKSYSKIVKTVKAIKPELVHFHDPELMFIGRLTRKWGIPTIFDIHENVAVQILDKAYIPRILRGLASYIYRKIENHLIKKFDLIIAETSYEKVYIDKGASLTQVLNMPDTAHFKPFVNIRRMGSQIFYIGGISDERGLYVTIEALKILKERGIDFFMHYLGPISEEKLQTLQIEGIADYIKFYGRIDSKIGFEISKECIVGLSVLKPIKNYVGSYSTKIFEYMAVGLPVITSNFPLYTNVVEKYNCGYCINPFSSVELADKIQELIENPELAIEMGKNGMDAVAEKFDWSTEERKLLNLYSSLINRV